MLNAYQEIATPGVFVFALSVVAMVPVLFSLWDPWDLRETLTWMDLMTLAFFVSGCSFVLCYANGVLVLYLARFRSRVQASLLYGLSAVVLAVPCTVMLYGGHSVLHGGMAPRMGIATVYSVVAVSALWATALTFYFLVLRLERQEARAVGRKERPDLVTSAEQSGELMTDVMSPGRAVPVPDTGSTTVDRIAESFATEDSSVSVRNPGLPLLGSNEVDHDTAIPVERAAGTRVRTGSRGQDALDEDVAFVRVSGHYIDVVTTSGTTVLMMRLADAVIALGGRGMQTHRSYWVAFRHMRRLVRTRSSDAGAP